jgi:hypothetical protein
MEIVQFNKHYNPTKYGVSMMKMKSRLHDVINNPTLLARALDSYQQDQLLEALKLCNHNDEQVLFAARYKPKSIALILATLPPQQVLEAISLNNEFHDSLLAEAADYPKSLKVIYRFLTSQQDCLKAAQLRTKEGYTLLHSAALEPQSLKLILDSLAREKRAEQVKEKNYSGKSLLHLVVAEPESMEIVLKKVRPEDIPLLAEVTDAKGNTVLHSIFSSIRPVDRQDRLESFKLLLNELPQEKRLAVLQAKNRKGLPVLHCASSDTDFIEAALNAIPIEQRVEAVMTRNESGRNLLEWNMYGEANYKVILSSLPDDDARFNVVRHSSLSGLQRNDAIRDLIVKSSQQKPNIFDIFFKAHDIAIRALSHRCSPNKGSALFEQGGFEEYPIATEEFLDCIRRCRDGVSLKQTIIHFLAGRDASVHCQQSLQILLLHVLLDNTHLTVSDVANNYQQKLDQLQNQWQVFVPKNISISESCSMLAA